MEIYKALRVGDKVVIQQILNPNSPLKRFIGKIGKVNGFRVNPEFEETPEKPGIWVEVDRSYDIYTYNELVPYSAPITRYYPGGDIMPFKNKIYFGYSSYLYYRQLITHSRYALDILESAKNLRKITFRQLNIIDCVARGVKTNYSTKN